MQSNYWQKNSLLLSFLLIGIFISSSAVSAATDNEDFSAPAFDSNIAVDVPNTTNTELPPTEPLSPPDKQTSATSPTEQTPPTSDTTPAVENNDQDPFPDVTKGSQYFVGIKYLKDQDLINGYPDGNFRPNQNINRAEALKLLGTAIKYHLFSNQEKPLVNLQSSEEIQPEKVCPFHDLDTAAWYYSYVCQAFHNYVVNGYPDGNFKPEQTINKVEALKMSILQSGLSTEIDFNDNFNDISPNDWYWNYARLANQRSFIVEDRQGNLNPGQTFNRGDFSMLVYRIIKAVQNNSEFGRATFYGGRFDGQSTANGETFSTGDLTAAHKTLPFGTIVKVTNLANGKSVNVRINDRGPYVNGTIIDLSTNAFTQIASKSTGVIDSEVEIIQSP